MPAPVDPAKKQLVLKMIQDGFTQRAAAEHAGVSISFVKKYLHGLEHEDGESWRDMRAVARLEGPIPLAKLCPEAKRALEDIAYFALRYFGAIVMPWQVEATDRIVAMLTTPEKEFGVVNCPPGSGKSTFFTLILPAWLTCRNRAIRGMIVSNTQRNAETYLVNLRRTLEEPVPIKASDNDMRLGIAVDAEQSIVKDFGLFRTPGSTERWTAKAFQVMQHKGRPVSEKESTWQAFGRGGAILGNRVDFIICDDVYDTSQNKTVEARQDFKSWFDKHVETRLEPNGLLVLQGQRQDADDVYRYCLDKRVLIDVDGDDIEDEDAAPRKYQHIKFKAHYDELCSGDHKDVKPYPEGCLLYPKRIKWRDLRSLNARELAVEYQQEDIATTDVLVDPLWVSGGRDPKTNVEYVGCWDKDRGEWELPPGLTGDVFVVATADPSPTRYWSLQCWAYHPATSQRFLVAHHRQKMDAPDLLDWNLNEQRYVGVMDAWQTRSEEIGHPIRYWIVEDNAAQRFLLQYDYAQKWRALRGVDIVRHSTNANKADPKLGVPSIATVWRTGQVRLPGRPFDDGRLNALKLVAEVTRWPEGATDDCVMAEWFFEWNLPRLYAPTRTEPYRFNRPSWMRDRPTRADLRVVA